MIWSRRRPAPARPAPTVRADERGVALVSLIIFVAIAMVILMGAITVTVINIQSSSGYSSSETALAAAEAGADNAVMRTLRDPTGYNPTAASPDIVPVGAATATITISGTTTRTIISDGASGSFHRRVQVVVTLLNNIVTVTSWSQID
jgi:hypothetical protein